MTGKQRATVASVAVSLFILALNGVDKLEAGKTKLGTFMLAGAVFGTIILVWRIRGRAQATPAGQPEA